MWHDSFIWATWLTQVTCHMHAPWCKWCVRQRVCANVRQTARECVCVCVLAYVRVCLCVCECARARARMCPPSPPNFQCRRHFVQCATYKRIHTNVHDNNQARWMPKALFFFFWWCQKKRVEREGVCVTPTMRPPHLALDLFLEPLPPVYLYLWIQPIADRVAQNLEIISNFFSTNQNSAHGIYD